MTAAILACVFGALAAVLLFGLYLMACPLRSFS